MTSPMLMSILILSPMMMMSMKSWIPIWMMLELSSMSFIMMMKKNPQNESSMVYFLAQSLGSMMILFSIIQMNNQTNTITEKMTMMMGMMMKMGLIPFHQWFVMLGSMISMNNLLILSTVQKTAPFMLMSWSIEKTIMMTILMMSMSISLITQMSQQSIKKILIYSSIFQTSWIMILTMMDMKTSIMYFIIYSTTLMMVIKEMEKNEKSNLTNQETKMNLNLMINMVSMSGIPPMMGFIPKWMILKNLSKENSMTPLTFMMIITSIISFFIYFRMFFSIWMKSKMNKTLTNMKSSMSIQILTPMLMMTYN